jgi:peroxiredoxin
MRLATVFSVAVVLVVFAGILPPSRGQSAGKGPGRQVEKEWLKGLRKAGPGDLDLTKPIPFDPDVTPVYLEDGERVKSEDLMKMMPSGNYVPEPYINDRKEIKAFVLRAATKEEKKMFQSRSTLPGAKGHLVGREATPFSVKDIKGNNYSLGQLKGKVVVVNFWFVECLPCRIEIPELNKLVDEYKGKDVVFLGLATNDRSKLEEFLKKYEFKYAIVPDSVGIAREYGVAAFPAHMVIGRDSRITYFAAGYMPTAVSTLKGEIDKLLGK